MSAALASVVLSAIVPNHMHCRVCGRAMKFGDEKVCSTECQKQVDEIARKRKQLLWFIYGMIGVSVIFLILQVTRGA